MKKRIGTKLYDTEKGILVLPEKNLYKQPRKKTFYIFDGEKITPISYTEAFEMIKSTGKNDLLSMLKHKGDVKGNTSIRVSTAHADKLAHYSRLTGISQKTLVENFIDSLSME